MSDSSPAIIITIFSLITLCSVGISGYIAARRRIILFGASFVFTAVLIVSFFIEEKHTLSEWLGLIKQMALWPLGLGLTFGISLLSRKRQTKNLHWFTLLINASAAGNIVMMMFIPFDGSYRNIASKVTCFLLVAWLIQEMYKHKWRTVEFDGGFFIFNSATLLWIFSHSLYRASLVSLPIFDSFKYILLEPLSLASMYLLYKAHNKRHRLNYYFGLAETVTVPTVALCARGFDLVLPQFSAGNGNYFSERQLDLFFVPILMVVAFFAGYQIFRNVRFLSHSRSAARA